MKNMKQRKYIAYIEQRKMMLPNHGGRFADQLGGRFARHRWKAVGRQKKVMAVDSIDLKEMFASFLKNKKNKKNRSLVRHVAGQHRDEKCSWLLNASFCCNSH